METQNGGRLALAREPQRFAAARVDIRRQRSSVRADLRAGRIGLEDVLLPVLPIVADRELAEIIRWQWRERGLHARPTMEELGRFAVRDGVNLLLAAGHASAYTRAWVVEHGSKRTRRRAEAA